MSSLWNAILWPRIAEKLLSKVFSYFCSQHILGTQQGNYGGEVAAPRKQFHSKNLHGMQVNLLDHKQKATFLLF